MVFALRPIAFPLIADVVGNKDRIWVMSIYPQIAQLCQASNACFLNSPAGFRCCPHDWTPLQAQSISPVKKQVPGHVGIAFQLPWH